MAMPLAMTLDTLLERRLWPDCGFAVILTKLTAASTVLFRFSATQPASRTTMRIAACAATFDRGAIIAETAASLPSPRDDP